MIVRPLEDSDIGLWTDLRCRLWPDEPAAAMEAEGRASLKADPPLVVFVADDAGRVIGFIELDLRSVAEGCTSSPVPYIEGRFVDQAQRGQGVGAALMAAAEAWSREHGFTELASDTQADNRLSQQVHRALGFEQAEALIVFRKDL